MKTALIYFPGITNMGGAERVAIDMARTLVAAADKVLIASDEFELSAKRHQIEQQHGIRLDAKISLVQLPRLLTRIAQGSPRAINELATDLLHHEFLRKFKADIFINAKTNSNIAGAGARNYYYTHFPHPLAKDVDGRLRKAYINSVDRVRDLAFRKPFLQTYNQIWANSEFTARSIRTIWGVDAAVLYPGCTPIITTGAAKEKLIITVGRFQPPLFGHPHKAQATMLRAWRELSDLHADGWNFVLAGGVGGAPAELSFVSSLETLAEGTPHQFAYNLTRVELEDLYSRATVYWHAQGFGTAETELPRCQEHFGITTVEAMSAGAIPIVFRSGGPLEITAPLGDMHSWNTLKELQDKTRHWALGHSDEREHAEQACRRRASDFDYRHFQESLLSLCS